MKKSIILIAVLLICATGLFAQTKAINASSKTTVYYSCVKHPEVRKQYPGKCPECGRKLKMTSKSQINSNVIALYTCPMHPDIVSEKEGKCTKCGATLIKNEVYSYSKVL